MIQNSRKFARKIFVAGLTIAATSSATLWGQVPIVKPAEMQVPIVRPSDSLVPIVRAKTPQSNQTGALRPQVQAIPASANPEPDLQLTGGQQELQLPLHPRANSVPIITAPKTGSQPVPIIKPTPSNSVMMPPNNNSPLPQPNWKSPSPVLSPLSSSFAQPPVVSAPTTPFNQSSLDMEPRSGNSLAPSYSDGGVGLGHQFVQPPVGELPVVTMEPAGMGGDSGYIGSGCGCDELNVGDSNVASCDGSCGGECETCSTAVLLDIFPRPNLRGRIVQRAGRRLGFPGLCGGICNVGFDNCGYISQANRYFIADALYWKRGDGGVVGTNFGGPSEYPWNWGWRGTLGWRQDEIVGYEATYFGFLPSSETVNQSSVAGAIDARFLPTGGLTTGLLNSFFNANLTRQQIQTRFHSVEFSRVRFGWDVVKTSIGLRYMWFDDQYRLDSQNANLGAFQMKAVNNMIGPDVGLELLYDVGRRISFSGRVKGGAYADFYRFQTNLVNNGTQFIGNQHDAANLSASLELGANAFFRVGQRCRLRGGYDALWLYNVLSVSENLPSTVTPLTGFSPDDSRRISLHGVSFGIEFYR